MVRVTPTSANPKHETFAAPEPARSATRPSPGFSRLKPALAGRPGASYSPAMSTRLPLAMLLTCCALGCASLGKPQWLDPGPAANQRRKAVRFDPYLQDDIAPSQLRLPIMDGARPRDFLEPVPEVKRARWWAPVQ